MSGDGVSRFGSGSSANRRELLKQTAAAGALLALSSSAEGRSTSNPIVQENLRPGTKDWMLLSTQIDPKTKYRSPAIEGYCSAAVVTSGEKLEIMVSVREACSVSIDIYRMGYYDGMGGRLVHSAKKLPAKQQPTPEPGIRRLMVCDWKPTYELTIPKDWLSGVYLGKLTEWKTGLQSYVVFIVRDDRKADFVFQCSDHTWQAYNRWPSQFSLYDDGKQEWYWGGESQVSFRRPYGKYCQIFDAPLSTGSGEFLLWEFPFAYWMESQGYDVTYISNTDTHARPETLLRGKGLLSVGHDEYWTIEMYRNFQRAIEAGVNVGFFSGNAVCGRVRFDEATQSIQRIGVFGPPGGTNEFQSMSSLEHVPPYANEIIGAHSTGPVTGGSDWICSKPDHWIFEGTGMKQGEGIPGLVGWEWHGDPAPIPGLEVVSTGPTQSAPMQLNGGQYTATIYPGPKNNFVFNASTIWWGDGLSQPPGYVRPKVYTEPKGPDLRVQQITRNILNRMQSFNSV